MKHCLECLVCLLNQNKKQGVNGEVKSSNSLLMKTGYTSLLHFSFIISEGDYAGRLEAFYVFRRNNKKNVVPYEYMFNVFSPQNLIRQYRKEGHIAVLQKVRI